MSDNDIAVATVELLRTPTLAEFVRERRTGPTPKHPAGLTRKQLAEATHASLGYIAKIEQGEALNPGPAILDSLAGVLCLDAAERVHLYHLAQQRPTPPIPEPLRPNSTAASMVRTTLDALLPHLAAALDEGWYIVDCNSAFGEAFPGLGRGGHVLRWLFTDPRARIVIEEWEQEARLMVGRFRAYAAAVNDRDEIDLLLGDLGEHADFRRLWEDAHVRIGRPEFRIRLRNPKTASVFDVIVQRYRSTTPQFTHQLFIGLLGAGAA
ncbi:helix-turn-helix domain-containing protein [Nocardia sp. SYP-A9097]|uniref:MmyB family transcriptional regulator n=1 Tax=Nocardia sp. SYP-A9097 TaxID=2663237 RepID=UPI00129B280F|nr:helix-turn-helix domain-containing protein [Nocardia sp. SYP-A9097]MRH89162.1 helix-turn-helix domain-containing protein [Nocardia sp. SYP-A9097]